MPIATCRIFTSIHSVFFFFNDTATTEIYTLSLHDALPNSPPSSTPKPSWNARHEREDELFLVVKRSEEHTSELQSQFHLVCRLLLEKKKKKKIYVFFLKKKKKK